MRNVSEPSATEMNPARSDSSNGLRCSTPINAKTYLGRWSALHHRFPKGSGYRTIAATGADFRIGGDRAFYNPTYDFIQVPPPDAYFEPINWHRTALHELGHWTGAAKRLDRDLSGSFGSKKYAREELVAEITSAFVCASLGIVPTVRHADYIGSWLEVLREDDRAIVRAASAASKAADYLLAFCRESNECVEGVESSNHLLVSDRQETCA
jgi:antirestriction protein ArdC